MKKCIYIKTVKKTVKKGIRLEKYLKNASSVCVCSIGYHVEKFIKDFPLGHTVRCLWLAGGLWLVCLNVLVPVRWVHCRLIFEIIKGTAGTSPDKVAARPPPR